MNPAPPFFSLIIPTRARPEPLARCLSALRALDYPPEHWEVIVVNDGSAAETEAVTARFSRGLNLTLVAQAHAGPARARNLGADLARGDWLAFTDDDCAPAPDWLSALAEAAARWPGALLGGCTVNALPHNPYASASQALVDFLYDYYNSGPEGGRFVASNNCAAPAAAFRALGGFTPFPAFAGGEDRDLCDRWLARGHPLRYVPAAVVQHAHALNLRQFWNQHFNYGRGAYHFHRLRARRGQARLRVEPPAFYLRLLSRVAAGAHSPAGPALAALTQAANAAGFFRERLLAGGEG
jgi:GT2 family glycosyltransferase